MDVVNLRGVDLNLLVVLDVLLDERHVTRAGKRLGLSQPATSNALERLRELFGDSLLDRTPQGLRPTPRAEALREPLREALASAARVVSAARPDLATLQQTVRVSVVDYGLTLFLPPLLSRLAKSAPGVDLAIAPWAGADRVTTDLASGAIDLAVSVVTPGSTELRWETLFREEYVVAMRRGHPASKRFDLARWLAHPHVVVSGRGERAGALDTALAERGLARRVGLVVPSFLAVPAIVAASDLMALVPARVLRATPHPGVIVREPPLEVPGFEVGLAWHPRRDGDLATQHVRSALGALARRITPPRPRSA